MKARAELGRILDIVVEGIPVAKGNHRINPAGHIYDASKGLGQWQALIGWHARAAMRGRNPVLTPIALGFHFRLPKPAKPKHYLPITRPDWDKLSRAAADALSGVLYVDDGQIVHATVSKTYADSENPPGVSIHAVEVES